MLDKVKVAAAQIIPAFMKKEETIERVCEAIHKAGAQRSSAYCLSRNVHTWIPLLEERPACIPVESTHGRVSEKCSPHPQYYFRLGSSRSLIALPRKLKERMVRNIARPGKKMTWGKVRMARQPFCTNVPQLVPHSL